MKVANLEITELRQLMADHRAGKVSREMYFAILAGYAETEKRQRLLIQDKMIEIKLGIKPQAIEQISTDRIDPEAEMVNCPIAGSFISRGTCLDYSGDHTDDCRACEIGIETKRLLIPDQDAD